MILDMRPCSRSDRRASLRLLVAATAVAAAASGPARGFAQEEESSPDIELGSSRIGGPGLTEGERRRVRSWSEPETYVTEETLPDQGSRKRLPSLHVLAERYAGGQQWSEACRFYDMILDESGEEGLEAKEDGRANAARAFLGCAEVAFRSEAYDDVEVRLSAAESLGLKTGRSDFLRRKVTKERFHQKLATDDLVGARRLYDAYQAAGEQDEDERIWFGEQLARLAKEAKALKDDIAYADAMSMLEEIAPLNTEYRALRAEETGDADLVRNILLVVGTAVGAVVILSLLSRWRARARVGAAGRGGKKNPFLDDEDDL